MTNPPSQLLLDTDIVIHLLHKNSKMVTQFLDLRAQEVIFLLSPVVVAEIYAGALRREYAQIEMFLNLCTPLSLDVDIARLAGQYANQFCKAFQGISLEDYLIAATAKHYRCPLWTGNRKHYPMDDIVLYDPYNQLCSS